MQVNADLVDPLDRDRPPGVQDAATPPMAVQCARISAKRASSLPGSRVHAFDERWYGASDGLGARAEARRRPAGGGGGCGFAPAPSKRRKWHRENPPAPAPAAIMPNLALNCGRPFHITFVMRWMRMMSPFARGRGRSSLFAAKHWMSRSVYATPLSPVMSRTVGSITLR